MRWRAGLVAGLAIAIANCGGRSEPPRVVVPLPAPVTVAPTAAVAVAPPGPPLRPIVLGGSNAAQNAAWDRDQAIVVTERELWRFRVEQPDLVRMTALARPLGQSSVLAVARVAGAPAGRVAVGLEDGSVDILEPSGDRLRTLAAGRHVLSLRFSPDGKTLAVTRTNSGNTKNEWFERTQLVDVASGTVKSTVDGSRIVFDGTGKRVAARGGVYEVDGGRVVAPWREGFQVLLSEGVLGDMKTARPGQEVIAGDYVMRGFFGGSAFYASTMGKEVALIEASGAVTRIAASCGTSKKVTSVADAARGLVIGVCADGVVLTDLAKRTSSRLTFPVLKSIRLTPPEVVLAPGRSDFAIRGLDYPMTIVDPIAGTSRPATGYEELVFESYTARWGCAGSPGGRAGMACDNPAWRDDGAYRLRVHWGVRVTSRSGTTVIDWGMEPEATREAPSSVDGIRADPGMALEWHAGAVDVRTHARLLRYRLGKPPDKEPSTFAPTAACGSEPVSLEAQDRFTIYSAYQVKGDQVTSTIICHCTQNGCTRRAFASMGSLIAGTDDGTLLWTTTNSYHSETTVELYQPGKPVKRAKVPGGCLYGAFKGASPKERAVLACHLDERTELFELSLPDLAIVRRRAGPPIGQISGMLRTPKGVLAISAERQGRFGALLDEAWFAEDKPLRPTAFFYAWPSFGISATTDGKLEIAGDHAAATFGLRCHDGTRLLPFEACASNVVLRTYP